MTARIVSPEEEEETPTIESVFSIEVKEKVDGNADPFAVSGDDLKKFTNVSRGFKRTVSNKLQKAKQPESKRNDFNDVLTGYDAFGVITPPHNMLAFCAIYEMSAPHYAAINAKVSNIVGLGYKLVESPKMKRQIDSIQDQAKMQKTTLRLQAASQALQDKLENLNPDDSFTEILVKVWRDYEIMGNGYLEIGRNADGTIGYLGHIPATHMRVRRDRDGFVQIASWTATFFKNFGHPETLNPIGPDNDTNEILHIKKYSPNSIFYGIPDVVAAQAAIAGNEFAARYNLDYFENKAVPRYIITLKGANLGQTAKNELLSFFETSLKGKNHRSLFVPLPPDRPGQTVEMNFQAIEAKIQDSSFNNYNKNNNSTILMVHRVPMTKISISENASLAIAQDADKTFKEQVCGPEQDMMEKKLNRIIKEFTDAFTLDLNEMTLTNEDTQSKIDERNVKAGITVPNEVRSSRGLPQRDDGNDLVQLNKQTGPTVATPRTRDQTRSSNATDSNGKARNPKGQGRSDGTQ